MSSMAPISQTFTLMQPRCLIAVGLKAAALGDVNKPIYVQLRKTDLGFPTSEILSEAYVDARTLEAGQSFTAVFPFPVYVPAAVEHSIVVATDDPNHALAIGTVGRLDQDGALISTQPFTVGVLMSSSNGSTWTAHQESDLVFSLIACRFTATEKVVNLGTFDAAKMSDIIVSAGVEYPEAGTDVQIVLKRPNGTEIYSDPEQKHTLSEFIQNEAVQVRAILRGSETLTPFLFPNVQIIEGELQTEADYVTRAVDAEDVNKVMTTFDALLPSGSTANVQVGVPGDFVSVPVSSATPLGDGLVEQTFIRPDYPSGNLDARTKITITGTPAARPELSGLRMILSKV